MRYYLKATRRATLALFHRGSADDYSKLDEIERYNREIMETIYIGIMTGSISGAYIRHGERLDLYTRSLRGDFVQLSHFCDLPNGETVATSHHDAHSAAEMEERHGCYINILTA